MIINTVGCFCSILKANHTCCIIKQCGACLKHQETEAPSIPKSPASKRQNGQELADIRFIRMLCMENVHLQCVYAVLEDVQLDSTKPKVHSWKCFVNVRSTCALQDFTKQHLKKLLRCLANTTQKETCC